MNYYNMAETLKVFTAAVCGLCSLLWGEMNELFVAFICFMVIDYATGVLVAIKNKELSSEIGFRGITKKAVMILMVAVGNLIDVKLLGTNFCKNAVLGFYCANEGLSILENAGTLGAPYPKFIYNVLLQVQEKNDEPEQLKSNKEEK